MVVLTLAGMGSMGAKGPDITWITSLMTAEVRREG